MGVLPVTKEQLGKKRWHKCQLTHCLLPTSTVSAGVCRSLSGRVRKPGQHHAWLDVGRSSGLDLTYQTLNVKMICHTSRYHSLTRVITAPTLADGLCGCAGCRAATSICHCASWFGSRSGWRGQNFPVLYNNCRIGMPLSLQPTTNGRTSSRSSGGKSPGD